MAILQNSGTTNEPARANVRSGRSIDNLRADLSKVAKSMYTQNLALNEKNRTLSILQAIDAIILDFNRDLKQLGNDISKAITDSSKFSMVGIFSLEFTSSKNMHFQGWSVEEKLHHKMLSSGILPRLVKLKLSNEGTWAKSNSKYLIVDFNDPNTMNQFDSNQEDMQKIFSILKNDFELNCLYITKLHVGDNVTGFLTIGLEEPMPHLDDIELIERIGGPTAIALFNRILFDENKDTLLKLEVSNEKLKEIDATKDEFIGMASHQLRTPLTSMKGYLSMVLDGDYGKISDEQHDVLQKSFNSSQRMVYLIADLLNVSRLRTGKFVMINKLTDLTSMVDEELNQLQESFKAKNITLTYKKSENIPKIMLDPTKIRQVVMNFLDNALYYTPSGKSVDVRLIADKTSVSYTVTDTGMGVPKDEQSSLFTKFYRASNARKARPDGNGLGLYMAAKVIEAQDGNLIFYSIEGKGSTFGFRFPIKLNDPDKAKTP